jgi:hypothetical protein
LGKKHQLNHEDHEGHEEFEQTIDSLRAVRVLRGLRFFAAPSLRSGLWLRMTGQASFLVAEVLSAAKEQRRNSEGAAKHLWEFFNGIFAVFRMIT